MTYAAVDFEHFVVEDLHYLVVANSGASNTYRKNSKGLYDGKFDVDSVIYRWNPSTSRMEGHHTIPTHGARDWEHFVVGESTYLVVANERSRSTTHHVSSAVFKWDSCDTATFATTVAPQITTTSEGYWQCGLQDSVYEEIFTQNGVDSDHFTIAGDHYVAFANYAAGESGAHVNSAVFKWDIKLEKLVLYQSLSGGSGTSVAHYTVANATYVALTTYSFFSKQQPFWLLLQEECKADVLFCKLWR